MELLKCKMNYLQAENKFKELKNIQPFRRKNVESKHNLISEIDINIREEFSLELLSTAVSFLAFQ